MMKRCNFYTLKDQHKIAATRFHNNFAQKNSHNKSLVRLQFILVRLGYPLQF